MIQEGKWYLIAHAVGNDIKGEINIAFGSFNLLFSASYNFAGASISAIDHSIPVTVTFDIRIQNFGSYKQVDIKFVSTSPDYNTITPTIEIISGSDWILQAIQEAVTTNVVCSLSEVKTDSGGSFDFSDLFEFNEANQAIRAKHPFYADSWIGFYGEVGPEGSTPVAQSLLDLSDIDPTLAVAVTGMPLIKLSNGKWGPGSVSIDLSNYFNKGESDERYSFKSHSHDYVPTATFNSHTGDSVKHTTQEDKDKIIAAYNDKHTHNNKANLDTINQDLSKSSSVEFADLVSAGSVAFYGGTGGGSTPASSLLNLSDIDSSLATAAVGSPLVKLANGKWGPGSVSIDLTNYFTKEESDARFAFKSHSHDYVAPSAFNAHTGDTTKHITSAERVAWNAKESALGNPDVDGKILASTAGGVRSWVNRYVLPIAAAAMLGGVMIGANVNVDAQGRISVAAPYSHPATHPASMIDESATRRFLTDAERANWNDSYDKRHTHGNKANLDSINQNLSQTSNVKFNDVIADGSVGFYGGVGSGSTPVASLLDLSDIDASISTAATGTPLVKLSNGKWGAGSVSIDLSNYYNKSDADARYAFKSHSHDYVTTSVFNGHNHNGTYALIAGSTSQAFSVSSLTATNIIINRDTTGLRFNRSVVSAFCGINYATANSLKWFVGLRENLSSNNYIIFNESTISDALTISYASNAATFISSVAATSFIEGSVSLADKYLQKYSATHNHLPYWNGSSFVNSNIINTTNGVQIPSGAYRGTWSYSYPSGMTLSAEGANISIESGWNSRIILNTGASGYENGLVYIPYGKLGIGYTDRLEKFAVNGSGYFSGYFKVETTPSTDTPVTQFINTGNSPYSFNWGTLTLAPNLGSNTHLINLIGVAANSKNAVYMGFTYVGSGSNSNKMTFGFHSSDHLFTITPLGEADLAGRFKTTSYIESASYLKGQSLQLAGSITGATTVVASSYIQAAYYKLGTWEIKENASGELEFIQSGVLKFKGTSAGLISQGEVGFYS